MTATRFLKLRDGRSPLPTTPRQRVEPLPQVIPPSVPSRAPPPPPSPLPLAPAPQPIPLSNPMQQPMDGQDALTQTLTGLLALFQTQQQPARHPAVPAQAWGPNGAMDPQTSEALNHLRNMIFNPPAPQSPATPSQWPAFTQPIPTFQTPSHPQTFQNYRPASPATPALSAVTPLKRRVPREDSTPSYTPHVSHPETSDASTRKRKQRRVSYQNEQPTEVSEDETDSALPTLPTARPLFTNKRGQPIVFYVQIDMKNRRHILSEIKVRHLSRAHYIRNSLFGVRNTAGRCLRQSLGQNMSSFRASRSTQKSASRKPSPPTQRL